jgi:CRP-like cAMP-binding protein
MNFLTSLTRVCRLHRLFHYITHVSVALHAFSEGAANVFQGGKLVAPLGVGDYFGENSLLQQAPRLATVTASSPLTCLALGRTVFLELFGGKSLNVQFAKRRGVQAEKTNDDVDGLGVSAAAAFAAHKTPAVSQLISKAVSSNVLFKSMDADQVRGIVEEMHRFTFTVGQKVMEQGSMGDKFYVVESGTFNVVVETDGVEKVVARRGPGQSFGELALMYHAPRAATVVCTGDAVLWGIDRLPFRRITKKAGMKFPGCLRPPS